MGMNVLVRKVLSEVGLNPRRYALQWASAAEAPRFVKLITEFTKEIKELGPLGAAEGIAPAELKARLEKGLAVVSDRKVRMAYGAATKTVRKDEIFTQEHITAVMDEKMAKSLSAVFGTEGKG
jgi:hypothetical protein